MKQDTGKHKKLKKIHASFQKCRFMLHPDRMESLGRPHKWTGQDAKA